MARNSARDLFRRLLGDLDEGMQAGEPPRERVWSAAPRPRCSHPAGTQNKPTLVTANPSLGDMSLVTRSFSALLPRGSQLFRRWMGRAPLFWRRLPPPPGFMPRAEPVTVEDIGMSYLVRDTGFIHHTLGHRPLPRGRQAEGPVALTLPPRMAGHQSSTHTKRSPSHCVPAALRCTRGATTAESR